jgi:hypothetical protein
MQHFQNEEAVQDKGSSALWGVLSPPNEPQSTSQREIDSYIQRVTAMEVLEAGGVFVLINNLKLHAGHANVAYSAVGALLAIAQVRIRHTSVYLSLPTFAYDYQYGYNVFNTLVDDLEC